MDWGIILIIVILLFGPKKLPELARGLGRSFGEFRKAKDEIEKEFTKAIHQEEDKTIQKPVGTIAATPAPIPAAVPAPRPAARKSRKTAKKA
ncbi:MAG: twin-arginine translocase TatA/TatE family subunit [Methylacidiphilales bacterium]|nr:twin-arginine translocase TatA/TatE family subunit [Candidatus Methylacidiphilales bacterium]